MNQFINKYADTQLKTDILLFWNRYPYANFTAGAIANSVRHGRKADVAKVLEGFVTDEFVEKHVKYGQPFYKLTNNPEKREPVLKLSECIKGIYRTSARGRRQSIKRLVLKNAFSI